VQTVLGISSRAYRKDLERAVRQLARRYELVREGRWCESRRSLVLAYVAGVAGPRKSAEAKAHLAACPGCARMAAELRRASRQAAAVLPLPDMVIAPGTFHRAGDLLAGAREGVADLSAGTKQQVVALANRAADPTPLASARPGATLAALAGCLAIGSGATYCAVEGIPEPLRGPLGLEQRAGEPDKSHTRQTQVQPAARATQVEPTAPLADPPTEVSGHPPPQEVPSAPLPAPAEPAPPSEAEQANREFGIERAPAGQGSGEFSAPPPPGAGAASSPGQEFAP
jgi:hypothetical protein